MATITRRKLVLSTMAAGATFACACASDAPEDETVIAEAPVPADEQTGIEQILASMSLEQKVSQLLMPAIRQWEQNDYGVYDLASVPALADALRRHQYGGVILFGQNIEDTEQTTRLVHDLQKNNAEGAEAASAPTIGYFVAADQEGGSVARLTMGTRGTGSMAIGATADSAEENARITGDIFGEELSALGINVNLGPCIDIIVDLADEGMSTRVFSDDPETVSRLGLAFGDAVSAHNVITCFKHFPGAGDGSDYPTAIHLTREDLDAQGLIPYRAVIDAGAEMVMVSATTFPEVDDEVVLADGVTTGFYPASMSRKIVGEILRDELGFAGVVMTDALEMDQFFEEPVTGDKLLPGERYGVECAVNIARTCLEAGCDVLLIPTDLASEDMSVFFDAYVSGICALVEDGTLSEVRINESVRRILSLKERRGILAIDTSDETLATQVAHAFEVVGSADHHARERVIAEEAITLLKDTGVLPLEASGKRVVIIGRTQFDANPIVYALTELVEAGLIDASAFIDNRLTGEVTGMADSATHFTIDRYYDPYEGALAYTPELSAAIADADVVVCLSAVPSGIDALADTDPRAQGVSQALAEAHAAGVPFVLLSDGSPVDVARYVEADVIVCCYLSAGFDIDPTGGGSDHMRAINANVPAALRAIFGMRDMPGRLPIRISALAPNGDGSWAFTDDVLFQRGSGA